MAEKKVDGYVFDNCKHVLHDDTLIAINEKELLTVRTIKRICNDELQGTTLNRTLFQAWMDLKKEVEELKLKINNNKGE